MNSKSLLIAAVAVAVLGGAALVVSKKKSQETDQPAASTFEQPFVPGLDSRINDVAKVLVQDHDTSFTLAQTPEGWVVASSGGYPARTEVMRQMLLQIANLKKVEPKTSNEDKFSEIDLDDVKKKDSKAKEVRILDKSGKDIAAVLVGRNRTGLGAVGGPTNHFVRNVGDKQSWLVAGTLDVPTTKDRWMEMTLFNIQAGRVKSIRIEHGDGDVVDIVKEKEGDPNFLLKSVPPGRQVAAANSQNELANLYSYNRFEDVTTRETANTSSAAKSTNTVTTFDGLVIKAENFRAPSGDYTFLSASVDEPTITSTNAARQIKWDAEHPKPSAADGTTTGTLTPTPTPAVPEGPKLAKVEDIKKEADDINKVVAKWAYTYPSTTMDRLTKHNLDLTEAIPVATVEKPPEEPTPVATPSAEVTPKPTLPPVMSKEILDKRLNPPE